jgi:hypothetical protein
MKKCWTLRKFSEQLWNNTKHIHFSITHIFGGGSFSRLNSSSYLHNIHNNIKIQKQRTYFRIKSKEGPSLDWNLLHHKVWRRILASSQFSLDILNILSTHNSQPKFQTIPFGRALFGRHGQIVPQPFNCVRWSAPCNWYWPRPLHQFQLAPVQISLSHVHTSQINARRSTSDDRARSPWALCTGDSRPRARG